MSSSIAGRIDPTLTQLAAVAWRVGKSGFGQWHGRAKGSSKTLCGIDLIGIRASSTSLATFTQTIREHRCKTCLAEVMRRLEASS